MTPLFYPQNFYRHHQSFLDDRISASLFNGNYLSNSERIRSLEATLARTFGFNHAVCVGSVSDALKISAQCAVSIDREIDLAIAPAFAHTSVYEALLHSRVPSPYCAPRIIILDQNHGSITNISPRTANLSDVLLPGVKSIFIYPQLFGSIPDQPAPAFPPDTDNYLIIDASHSIGTDADNRFTLPGDPEPFSVCISFNPNGPLGSCTNGGAILTNNPELAVGAHRLRNHGFGDNHFTAVCSPGASSMFSSVGAEFVFTRLDKLQEDAELRISFWNEIRHALDKYTGIARPVPYSLGVPSMFTAVLDPCISRRQLCDNLTQFSIPHSILYPCLSHHFSGRFIEVPYATDLTKRVISFSVDPYQPVSGLTNLRRSIGPALEGSILPSNN